MDFKRLIWMMDDETINKLQSITKQHVTLAKEAIQPHTTHERKQEIVIQIAELRNQRETIFKQFKERISRQ